MANNPKETMVIGVYDIRLRNSNSGKQDRNGYNGHEILTCRYFKLR